MSAAAATFTQIAEERDLNRLYLNNFGKLIVLVFHADWYTPSLEYAQQFEKLVQLKHVSQGEKAQYIVYARLDAERLPQVAHNFGVVSVPTVVVTDAQSKQPLLPLASQGEPASLALQRIEELLPTFLKSFENERVQMYAKIEQLLRDNPVMVFIKGTADDPFCKFSREFIEVIRQLNIRFGYYDILADEKMRNWLRHYDKWNTYPQLFFKGELIGGLDKTKELIAQGVLQQKIPAEARLFDAPVRLQKLLQDNKVLLFVQNLPALAGATPEQPDQSTLTAQLLRNTGIKFNCFNTHLDAALEGHLQQNFAPNKLPLLFADGKLVGGYEQLQTLAQQNALLPLIPGSEWRLDSAQKIDFLLKSNEVLVFVEGVAQDLSENSRIITEALKRQKVLFEFFNVSAESEALKLIQAPALYLHGKLVGGAQVVQKLEADGDLAELLKDLPHTA